MVLFQKNIQTFLFKIAYYLINLKKCLLFMQYNVETILPPNIGGFTNLINELNCI
jgi:hypothetical protein